MTEWDEPQAVIGSYLQRYAYPDYYRLHVEHNGRELIDWTRGKTFDSKLSGETNPIEEFGNIAPGTDGAARCLQLRGEYMFVAEGKGGFRVYDVASIANKGFSERIVTAPFSPLGQDTHVDIDQRDLHGAADQPADRAAAQHAGDARRPTRSRRSRRSTIMPSITDAVEGLILVNVDTLADGEPRNNFLKRARDLEPGRRAEGRAPHHAGRQLSPISPPTPGWWWSTSTDPLQPAARRDACRCATRAPRALQFRYLWVTTPTGCELLDVTRLDRPGRGARARPCRWPMRAASISRAPTPMSRPGRTGW